MQRPKMNRDTIREHLQSVGGKEYWRSLEELAGTPEFQDFLEREFPREASVWGKSLDRRTFLKLLGASLALAGLSACARQPEGKIVPYVTRPEDLTPGKPNYYATALVLGGYAQGVLAESHMGRPTKIEGNPHHPASLGAASAWAQASLLDLYDPDRSQVVLNQGETATQGDFLAALMGRLGAQRSVGGPASGF